MGADLVLPVWLAPVLLASYQPYHASCCYVGTRTHGPNMVACKTTQLPAPATGNESTKIVGAVGMMGAVPGGGLV
jgi:hypothetical protein